MDRIAQAVDDSDFAMLTFSFTPSLVSWVKVLNFGIGCFGDEVSTCIEGRKSRLVQSIEPTPINIAMVNEPYAAMTNKARGHCEMLSG